MTTADQENRDLVESLEEREAGVAELMKYFADVEQIYVPASLALAEDLTITTTNSTNIKRKMKLTICDMCEGTGSHCCGCLFCYIEHSTDPDIHFITCPICQGAGKVEFVKISATEDDGI